MLLPAGHELDDVLAHAPSQLRTDLERLRVQRYPRAQDPQHLESLVLSTGDRDAITEDRSVARSSLQGSALGALGSAALALLAVIDIPWEAAATAGAGSGALLGVLGHHSIARVALRPEVGELVAAAGPDATLVSLRDRADDSLRRLQALCTARGLSTRMCATAGWRTTATP